MMAMAMCDPSISSCSRVCSVNDVRLTVISYNLHGLNQGTAGVTEVMNKLGPEVIMVQEHWLSTDNLSKLSEISDDYFVFGSSALDECLSTGPLYGRPFGGVAISIKKIFADVTCCLVCSERYIAVLIADWLFINVYMPCSGTSNRLFLYADILQEIQLIIDEHPNYNSLLGGDFNVNLDTANPVSSLVNGFMCQNNLKRGDVLFPSSNKCTYVNESLNVSSCIDYMLTLSGSEVVAFNILDLDINLSDHLPIMAVCLSHLQTKIIVNDRPQSMDNVKYLRWDHAPLHLYYEQTRLLLEPVLEEISVFEATLGNGTNPTAKM